MSTVRRISIRLTAYQARKLDQLRGKDAKGNFIKTTTDVLVEAISEKFDRDTAPEASEIGTHRQRVAEQVSPPVVSCDAEEDDYDPRG